MNAAAVDFSDIQKKRRLRDTFCMSYRMQTSAKRAVMLDAPVEVDCNKLSWWSYVAFKTNTLLLLGN